MKSTIITIGDEILIGQILDTNSRQISQSLNAAGITVCERTSIGDDAGQIVEALDRALGQSNIVIMTGGLGPTKDDITKHTLTRYFGTELVYDERVGEHVRTMLARRGIEFNDFNRGQAMVPKCCTVLFNAHGTAPGMWFERGDSVVVSLPGVPFEMQHLMEDEVMPRLRSRFTLHSIVHRTMITSGIAESMLAARISDWENSLPKGLKLAYLPAPNIVRLRLSAYEVDGEEARSTIDREFAKLYKIIPGHIVGFEQATVQELVHRNLTDSGRTLAVAESCTGGNVAARVVSVAGASACFRGSVVAYANDVKEKVLGVSGEDLERHGAVSEPVVRQMAEGVRRLLGADYGVATSGVAGPTGGTPEKPVGTVWIAVASPEGTVAERFVFSFTRERNIDKATMKALGMLLERVKVSRG